MPLILIFSLPAFAGEQKVYTNDDLSKYKTAPATDRQTMDKRDEELKKWEKDYDEKALREQEDTAKKEAEDLKQKKESGVKKRKV